MSALLSLVPRWVLAAVIAALAVAVGGLWIKNAALSAQVEKGKAYAASLESVISAGNAAAERQRADNEQRAREAESAAALREQRLVADAGRVRAELERLRAAVDSYTAPRLAAGAASIAPGLDAADPFPVLLLQCSERYAAVARAADGHASDVQTLMAAWPR